MGSQISRRWGLSDEQLLAPSSYRASALFTDIDKLVLDYAVAMSSTPAEVSDALFAQMRGRFEHAQLVELTHLIALENMRGRFNLALGIGAAGFSAGMVCGPHSLPAIRTRKRGHELAAEGLNEVTVIDPCPDRCRGPPVTRPGHRQRSALGW